jgi:hypothetical protein
MLASYSRAARCFLKNEQKTSVRDGARRVFVACLMLQAALVAPSVAAVAVIIKDDHGGNIGEYWSRFTAIRDAKQRVIIDGICSSACTMVLGIVPRDRICVTRNAKLGFHAAWRPGFLGLKTVNDPATQTLWNLYPTSIRQWISRNGGLGGDTIYLSGSELLALYPECH